MPPRLATLSLAFLACLISLFSPNRVMAQAATIGTIIAPLRLQQGDPLLAWMLTDVPVTGVTVFEAPVVEAKLVDAAGKVQQRAPCFAASAMFQADATSASLGGRRLFGALMSLSPETPPGAYELLIGGAGVFSSALITIEARHFHLETIHLDDANTRIRTLPSKRKEVEARKLFAILKKIEPEAVFARPTTFLFPVDGGWRSAGFGDVRRYVYPNGDSERSVHAGIDWAVVAGTAVKACARGKVLLVADREVTGKTVVVEHLPGLYSLYFHLSAIEVAVGAVVERGERIALSGSTGMSTGPHLHWELRAMGEAVDPERWLKTAILDKDAVLAIMSGLIEGR